MFFTVNRYTKEVLDAIHHENVSDPKFVAEEGIKQFRIHHQCLHDICRDIFFTCEEYAEGDSKAFMQQYQWCLGKAAKITELQKAKLEFIAVGNQARKERSLLEEKFVAVHVRFIDLIHERMNNLLTHLDRFVEKVDFLIMYPK